MFRHSTLLRTRLLKVATGLGLAAVLVAPGSALAKPAQIIKVNGTNLDCSLTSADATAELTAITRDRTDGGSFAFVDLSIEPTDPAASLLAGGMDDPPLTPSGFHTTFDMVNPFTDEVIGSATISATFVLTGSQRFHVVYQNAVQKGVFKDLAVSGTISVTSGAASYTFDMSSCVASTQHRKDKIQDPKEPKPGVKVPANDTSQGALPVTAGSQLQMQTAGASVAPETPCLVTIDGEVFEYSWGRTVWFTLMGTGAPITIDPAGSNFDTVVTAYVRNGAGLDQVACVDDGIFNAQGAMTLNTQAGITYLIQIGGVSGNFGSDTPEFGRLRLSVH
jgi:hypothetical protein